MKTFLTTICSVASAVLLASSAHSAMGTESEAWAFGWGSPPLTERLLGESNFCYLVAYDEHGKYPRPLSGETMNKFNTSANMVLSYSETDFSSERNGAWESKREYFITARDRVQEALTILAGEISSI
ncbi:MAG: hypothetical protein LBU35_01580 [Holosporales bacterium]|jgi:hypothetical protein|nr:hypothetical protein [Holosporales bacterium]